MPEKIGAARSALERSGKEANVRFRLVVPLTLLAVAGGGGGAKHAHRAAASHAAPPTTPPATLRRVAHLRRLRGRPLFWLGRRYDGLVLVQSDPEDPPGLTYADCAWTELDTLGLDCHRTVQLEEWAPAARDISTQGRCTYAGRVRGATVALFPVNPTTLRVFVRGTTVEITARSRREDLAAAKALVGLTRERRPCGREARVSRRRAHVPAPAAPRGGAGRARPAAARRGAATDEAKWAKQRDQLQQRFDGDSRTLTATVAAFKRAAYRVVVAPSGE